MTVVLKLGGSVITEKDRPETVDENALVTAAAALADADVSNLVVVHGGGSFGHPPADRHGVTRTKGTHDADVIGAIHDAMVRLCDAVVESFRTQDVPAVPIHPLSVAARDQSGDLALPTVAVETLLAEGFVPVLHGDVIAHQGRGATIVSGDELVVALAQSVEADRIGLCSGVPGVLDENADVMPTIEEAADVGPAIGGSEATDVTGGMAAKVAVLLDGPVPSWIFGLDALSSFLAGDRPGTRVGRPPD